MKSIVDINFLATGLPQAVGFEPLLNSWFLPHLNKKVKSSREKLKINEFFNRLQKVKF